jgi:hypothetical protein
MTKKNMHLNSIRAEEAAFEDLQDYLHSIGERIQGEQLSFQGDLQQLFDGDND